MNIQMLKRAIGTLFVLVLMIPGARAAETAGTVLYTAGKVTAVAADGSSRNLQRRSPVYVGDRLLTAAGARAQVRFTDGGIVALKPGSELRLDDYVDADAASSKNVMSLIKGGFRTMTGAIGQRNKAAYKVNTPVATIGVRGTLYEASYAEGNGLSLGVWDGGITACNDGGCIDLGMNADHRFGFVPVSGAPQGTREEPEGLGGDDDADAADDAGELGEAGEDSVGLDSLGGDDVSAVDLQDDSLFGPAVEVSRENYKQVGYAFIPGAGVIAASYARVEFDALNPPGVTGWSLVDDASGIELSDGPELVSCDGACYSYPSFNASVDAATKAVWGNWSQVDVGLSAGDLDPALSTASGYFLIGDYLSPAEVAQVAASMPTLSASLNSTLSTFDLSGQGPMTASGNISVDFTGAVAGNLNLMTSLYHTWNIDFSGTISGGEMNLGIDQSSSFMASVATNQVTGSIDASLFGSGGANPQVDGVIGGIDVATVGANSMTGNVETLQGIFLMNTVLP